jgi:hypothetical protein
MKSAPVELARANVCTRSRTGPRLVISYCSRSRATPTVGRARPRPSTCGRFAFRPFSRFHRACVLPHNASPRFNRNTFFINNTISIQRTKSTLSLRPRRKGKTSRPDYQMDGRGHEPKMRRGTLTIFRPYLSEGPGHYHFWRFPNWGRGPWARAPCTPL